MNEDARRMLSQAARQRRKQMRNLPKERQPQSIYYDILERERGKRRRKSKHTNCMSQRDIRSERRLSLHYVRRLTRLQSAFDSHRMSEEYYHFMKRNLDRYFASIASLEGYEIDDKVKVKKPSSSRNKKGRRFPEGAVVMVL
jgi:hypothetical protein